MHFVVNKADFFKSLQKVIGVIPIKTTIPILTNILLKLEDGKLHISGTDLEISISTFCHVDDAVDGALTLPGRKFFDIIRELPEVPIQFDADENNEVSLSTDKGFYKLIGEGEGEFPLIAVEEGETDFSLTAEKLIRMIDKTSFAVSVDELRTTLMGVYLQVLENEIRMVATDGHRLAKICHKRTSDNVTAASVILPTKALQLVSKNIEFEKQVDIKIGENHVTFSTPTTKIYSKIVEGQFPNYDRVIPIDNQLQMFVNRDLLAASVRRVSIFSNTYTHQIKLSLGASSLLIQAEDVEVGGEAKENIPIDYDGQAMEIGYNAAYVMDILRHLDGEDIVFNIKDPTSAAIIKPSEQQPDEDLMMLLMPIRLNDSI